MNDSIKKMLRIIEKDLMITEVYRSNMIMS